MADRGSLSVNRTVRLQVIDDAVVCLWAVGQLSGALRFVPGAVLGVGCLLIPCAYGQPAQTIRFDAIPGQILGVSPFPLAAQSSSLLPVRFTSTTPAVCTISADVVTLRMAGACCITAAQGGGSGYSAATPVTRNFTVGNARPSGSLVLANGNPFASQPGPVVTGDFNGDGIPDLVTSGYNSTLGVTVLLGNGLGGFTPAPGNAIAANDYPTSMAVGDFNGDGNQDVAVADGKYIEVLLGNGSGGLNPSQTSPIAAGLGMSAVAVADFNGDGIQDIVAADAYGYVVVLLGNGSGGFTAAPGSPIATGSDAYPEALSVADFNGDGIADFAVAYLYNSKVAVFLGNGSGGFVQSPSSPFTVASPGAIASGDFNGDGIPDIVTAGFSPGGVTVLLGDGSGRFTAVPGSPFAAGPSTSIVVADFNGDGIPDIVTGNYDSPVVALLLGSSSGSLTPAPISSIAVRTSIFLAVADFNGDGIEDVATSAYSPSGVTVLLGRVTGTAPQTIAFTSPNSANPGTSFALSATASSGLPVSFLSMTPGVCSVSGNTVTILALGTCSITATQWGGDTFAAAAPVTQSFSVVPAKTPPSVVSVTPNSGAATSGTFSFSYSSVNGYAYLSRVDALFNASSGGCWVYYLPSTNSIYLFSNTAASVYGPMTPGSFATLANDQCTIGGPSSYVRESGATLTLTLAITFSTYFRGQQNISGSATDAGGLTSGWQPLGTFTTGTPVAAPPTAVSVTPAAGSGPGGSAAFRFTSPNGYGYINRVEVLFNRNMSMTNGCLVIYSPSTNQIFLENDADTAMLGPLSPGEAGTLSNNQCSIRGQSSGASASENTLSLTLEVSFTTGFAGTQTIFGIAYDKANANGGWQDLGTWNVPAERSREGRH